MSHLADEIQKQHGEISPPPLWSGTIAKTAPDLQTTIPVVVPAFAGDLQLGPCRWQPRVIIVTANVAEPAEGVHLIDIAQVLLPTRGDACLVAFDENDLPWIVCWWPAA